MDNNLLNEQITASTLLNAVGALVVVFDLDDKIVLFNHACEYTTGYSSSEVIGRSIQELFITADENHIGGDCYQSRDDYKQLENYTNYWQTSEGCRRLIAWTNRLLTSPDGTLTHIIATGVDITEQRLGEDLIMRASEHQEIINQLLHIALEDGSLDKKFDLALHSIMSASWETPVICGCVYMLDEKSGKFALRARATPATSDGTLNQNTPGTFQPVDLDRQYDDIQYIEAGSLPGTDTTTKSHPALYVVPVKSRRSTLAVILLACGEGHNHNEREIFFLRTIANTLAGITEHHLTQEALSQSQTSLASAQQIAHVGSWEWNRHTGKLHFSDETRKILGLEAGISYTGHQAFMNHVYPQDKAAVLRAIRNSIRQKNEFTLDVRIMHSDDCQRYVTLRGTTRLDDRGRVTRIFGAIQDMTDRLLAEQELQLIASVFDSAQESIMVTDVNNRIMRVNQAFCSITGYTASEIIGKNPDTLNSEQHDAGFYENMWNTIRERGIWRGEVWNRRKNGEIYPEWRTISTVRDEQDEVIRYISISMDISEKKVAEERIHQLAHYDGLTKLPNRTLFKSTLSRECASSYRSNQALAVLFIGLDGIKRINDSMGHNIGDRVLEKMSTRLRRCIRGDDTVARWGGDEFALILTSLKQPDDAAIVARKILKALARPITLPDRKTIVVSASIGISLYPVDGDNSMSLIQNADIAMYKAKEKGGDCYQFYTAEMNIAIMEKMSLEAGLRTALEKAQFELYYQPVMNLETSRIIGAEALIRWNHPERGLVPPDQFIPVAEASGLIIPIGEWVIKQACQECKRWHDLGHTGLKISANLSARQFRDSKLVNVVVDALGDSGLEASYLTLELTESLIMDNAELTIDSLHMLKNTGVHLSIDDFGTGYSSLAYLKRFPIDYLKIDRSFVKDVDINSDDRSIVQTIIAMGHSMKLGIVAEGIEKAEHLEFLKTHACDEVQGYFISRPVPADGFLDFLHDWESGISDRAGGQNQHAGANR